MNFLKNLKIKVKINLILLLSIACSLIIMYFFTQKTITRIFDKEVKRFSQSELEHYKFQLKSLVDVAYKVAENNYKASKDPNQIKLLVDQRLNE